MITQTRIRVSSYREIGKEKTKRPFLQLLLFFNSGNELRYCTTKENPEDTNHPGLEVKERGQRTRRCYPKNSWFQLTLLP